MEAGELLTNEHFTVHVGNAAYGFARISNINAQLEYESVNEGGRNNAPLLFRKAKSRHDVLTLEKGVRLTLRGAAMAMDVGTRVTGVIIGIKKNHKECLNYTFDQGIVTKMELGNLDAMGHEILIKKMEIAHTGLRQMKQAK